ncbi:MAG: alpha/beta fold hydrolase [Opitutaceae bacterium]|nr:alpha/beta fold hydrolase [Opitutaceae bacterium]
MRNTLLFLAAALFCVPASKPFATETAAAPRHALAVAADRPDALYRRGETITFIVTLTEAGQPADRGEIEWTLTKDGFGAPRTGRAQIEHGIAKVSGTLDEPGFLQCRANLQVGSTKLTATGGAGIAPLDIKPSAPAPDDFDAFWAAKKKELAAVPVNAQLTPVKSAGSGVETFDVQADGVGAAVSGYLARPAAAKPRSHPAVLTVHGAGVSSSNLGSAASWAKEGAIAIDLNAHGLPNGREKAFYDALAAGTLKDYRVRGRESRDTVYFLGMFLRLVRAIDVLTAQPEWDGRTVVVAGSSQGGAQAIAAAGLDPRVTFFVAGVPAMCDHTGALAGRIAGWPKFIPTGSTPPANVVAAVRYFDAVNFAARTKAPGFFTVGFIDTTCPPTSVYAAYNALTAPKEIFNDITSGHTNTPAAREKMRAAVLRHFAALRSGPVVAR